MTTTITPPTRARWVRRTLPRLMPAAAVALAFGLGVVAGAWQAHGHAGTRGATAPVAALSSGTDVPASHLAGTAAPASPTSDDGEWASFLHTIQQDSAPRTETGLPAYQRLLGVTSDLDAAGALAVKWLVLDLGDYSIHSMDPVAP